MSSDIRKHAPHPTAREEIQFSSVCTVRSIIWWLCMAPWRAILGQNCSRSCNSRTIPRSLSTLEETPHYQIFGRAPVLPVDLILGVPATTHSQFKLAYSRCTVENLQLAYELARLSLKERADKQALTNETLSFNVGCHFPSREATETSQSMVPADSC